ALWPRAYGVPPATPIAPTRHALAVTCLPHRRPHPCCILRGHEGGRGCIPHKGLGVRPVAAARLRCRERGAAAAWHLNWQGGSQLIGGLPTVWGWLCRKEAGMSDEDVLADRCQLMADLDMIEIFRWYRMVFSERLVSASTSQDEELLATLRLEATYQLAEFYYVLKARGIQSEAQIKMLAELHNGYIADLTK